MSWVQHSLSMAFDHYPKKEVGGGDTNHQLPLFELFQPQPGRLVGLGIMDALPQFIGGSGVPNEGIDAHLVNDPDMVMHSRKEGGELVKMSAKVLELLDALADDFLDLDILS